MHRTISRSADRLRPKPMPRLGDDRPILGLVMLEVGPDGAVPVDLVVPRPARSRRPVQAAGHRLPQRFGELPEQVIDDLSHHQAGRLLGLAGHDPTERKEVGDEVDVGLDGGQQLRLHEHLRGGRADRARLSASPGRPTSGRTRGCRPATARPEAPSPPGRPADPWDAMARTRPRLRHRRRASPGPCRSPGRRRSSRSRCRRPSRPPGSAAIGEVARRFQCAGSGSWRMRPFVTREARRRCRAIGTAAAGPPRLVQDRGRSRRLSSLPAGLARSRPAGPSGGVRGE